MSGGDEVSGSDRDVFADTLASPSGSGGRPARRGPPTLPDGTLLGGTYRVEGLIGSGAMGAVYRATHEKLRRTFAVKLLVTDPALGIDAEAAWRLVQEARTASAIDHENIVDVTDLGQTDDGQIYVVMELLQGHDLDDRIEELSGTPMANDEVRELSAQMLEGLAAAHEVGVVHRDLKPANVFLSAKRSGTRVKLVDFGMAKALENKASVQLTRSGQLMGTPLYMSPEQARGEKVDRRSDVYAVGVMLYELLAGEVPFPATTLFECVLAHGTKEPPPLVDRRPDLPRPVIDVVHRCLAKAPDDRYDDARELAEAWRAAWSQGDVAETSAGAEALPPLEPRAKATEAILAQPEPASRGPWIAAAAVVLGLVGVGAWWSTQGEPSAEPESVVPEGEPTVLVDEAPAANDSDNDSESEGEDPGTEPEVEAEPELPTGAAPPRTVRLTSDPDGALVTDGDAELGRTPLDVELADAPRELRLTLRGHRPGTATLTPDGPDQVSVELRRRPTGMRGVRVPMLAPR